MIDLHVHTNVSDNSMSIGEVLNLAKEEGITDLAITDHDTTLGLNEALQLGKEIGVGIIPGIEISAFDYRRNCRAHILGLFVEPEHPSLKQLCDHLVQSRNEASYEMVLRINEAGYTVPWEDVQKYRGRTGVYKQHIMHALMDKGYCDCIYGDLYKKLFQRGDNAKNSGIAYVPLIYVSVAEAIKAVIEAGGIPVLAHPGQFNNFAAIDEWVELGLKGIEVFHPKNDEEDRRQAMAYAQKYQLLITGGSDFHGLYGESPIELGCKELDHVEWISALEKKRTELVMNV